MSTCQLRQIHKYHFKLSELVSDLKLAPFATDFTESLSEKSFQLLLELNPIHVVKRKGEKYECVGGIRQLMLAQRFLSAETSIPILVHLGKLNVEEMRGRLLVELYQQPALMAMAHGDTKMARSMAQKLKGLDDALLAGLELNTIELQSYWAAVSGRTIKRG